MDGIVNRTSYLMNSQLSHKTIRYRRWPFPRFRYDIGTSNFVAFNERDGAVMDTNVNDPVAATVPRQDDYDVWLGTGVLDKWIPWKRQGCRTSSTSTVTQSPYRNRTHTWASIPGGAILSDPSFYP